MESKKNKLKLGKSVEKTNPNYTKPAKIGGKNITSISPQYQIKQVTEQFGVYGEMWGFKHITLSFDLLEKYDVVWFKGVFFFPNGEFEIINSCKMHMDRDKNMIDGDFAKKIETDTLTKAISKLGFNADIFLGKFDDIKYKNDLIKEFETPEEKKIREEQEKQLKIAQDIAKKKAEEGRKQPLLKSGFDYLMKSENTGDIQTALLDRRMTPQERQDLSDRHTKLVIKQKSK